MSDICQHPDIQRFDTTRRHSKIVKHNGVIRLSGITAIDRSLDAAGQTRDILQQIEQLLERAGSDKTRMLSAEVWISDIRRDFPAVTEVWEAWVPMGSAPTRAACEALLPAPDILVEILITAAERTDART